MKTLIQNYSSGLSTEAMYFNQCLREGGLESHIWADGQISAFDIFDAVKPDIFISHYKFITTDIIKYLKQAKNIPMVLNVTGTNEQEIQQIESLYSENNIKTPFLFTNSYDSIEKFKPKKLKLVNILPSVDVFLSPIPTIDFQVDLAIIGTKSNNLIDETTKDKQSYHLLSLGVENENFDLPVDLKSLGGLYDKYKEMILIDDVNVVSSQIFFEASLKARKLSVKVDQSQQSTLDKIIPTLFDKGSDSNSIRQQIKKKHTCFNRTARLARFLNNEEVSKKLKSISEQL